MENENSTYNLFLSKRREIVIVISPIPMNLPPIQNIIYKKYNGYHVLSWSEIYSKVRRDYLTSLETEDAKKYWLEETSKRFFTILKQRKNIIIVDELMNIKENRNALCLAIRQMFLNISSKYEANEEKKKIDLLKHVRITEVEWIPKYGNKQLYWYKNYLTAVYDLQHLRYKKIDTFEDSIMNPIHESDIDQLEDYSQKYIFNEHSIDNEIVINNQNIDMKLDISSNNTFSLDKSNDLYDEYISIEEPLIVDRDGNELINQGIIIDSSELFYWDINDPDFRPNFKLNPNIWSTFFTKLWESSKSNYQLRIIVIVSTVDWNNGVNDQTSIIPNRIHYQRIVLKIQELNLPFPIYTLLYFKDSDLESLILYIKFFHSLNLQKSILFFKPNKNLEQNVLESGINIWNYSFIEYCALKASNQILSTEDKYNTMNQEFIKDNIYNSYSIQKNDSILNLYQVLEFSKERNIFINISNDRFPLVNDNNSDVATWNGITTWKGLEYIQSVILEESLIDKFIKISKNQKDDNWDLIDILQTHKYYNSFKPNCINISNQILDPEEILYLYDPNITADEEKFNEQHNEIKEYTELKLIRKEELPELKISTNSLINRFGPLYFQRGRDYFNHNHIKDLQISIDNLSTSTFKLRSNCEGSRSSPYTQETFFSEGSLIRDRCSCPLEGSCKHVIAQILEYFKYNDLEDLSGEIPLKPISFTELKIPYLTPQKIKGVIKSRSEISICSNINNSCERASAIVEDLALEKENSQNKQAKIVMFGEQVKHLYDHFAKGNIVNLENFHIKEYGTNLEFIMTQWTKVEVVSTLEKETKYIDFQEKFKERILNKNQDMFLNVDFDFFDEFKEDSIENNHDYLKDIQSKVSTPIFNEVTNSNFNIIRDNKLNDSNQTPEKKDTIATNILNTPKSEVCSINITKNSTEIISNLFVHNLHDTTNSKYNIIHPNTLKRKHESITSISKSKKPKIDHHMELKSSSKMESPPQNLYQDKSQENKQQNFSATKQKEFIIIDDDF